MKHRRAISTALALVAAVTLSGCLVSEAEEGAVPAAATTPAPTTAPPTAPAPAPAATQPSQAAEAEPAGGTALAVLATLPVDDVDEPGYDRDLFGEPWADVDNDGIDTRNQILARDLVDIAFDADGSTVLTGTLHDPYTATAIAFTRGVATSSAVQVDHVVALSNAWTSGMHAADGGTRLAVANDPLNLLATDGPTNGSKSDKDAAEWLPANAVFRCEYVARQIAVKDKYDLTVTTAEKGAMGVVLDTCPDQPLPADDTRQPTTYAAAAPAGPAAAAPAEPAGSLAGEPFANCDAARAAGAAPLHRGDPGWADRMDRDGDGTACE